MSHCEQGLLAQEQAQLLLKTKLCKDLPSHICESRRTPKLSNNSDWGNAPPGRVKDGRSPEPGSGGFNPTATQICQGWTKAISPIQIPTASRHWERIAAESLGWPEIKRLGILNVLIILDPKLADDVNQWLQVDVK